MRKLIHVPDEITDDLEQLAKENNRELKTFIEESLLELVRQDRGMEHHVFVQKLEKLLQEYKSANLNVPAHMKASSQLFAQELLKFAKDFYGI